MVVLLAASLASPAATLAESTEFQADRTYMGPFAPTQCVRMMNVSQLPSEARCTAGVLGNFLNYLIVQLSSALTMERIEFHQACEYLRLLWASVELSDGLPVSCQIEFLESPGQSLVDPIITAVLMGDGVALELNPVVSESGSVTYPYSAVLWVRQYRITR